MDDVLSEDKRDAETCLLNSYLLQILYLLNALDVKDGTQFARSHLFCKRRIHYGARGKVASGEQIQLTDLLLQSHLLHQFGNELIHWRQLLLLSCKDGCRREEKQGSQCYIGFLHSFVLFSISFGTLSRSQPPLWREGNSHPSLAVRPKHRPKRD